MALDAADFVRMGPIQSMGAGKAFPAARCGPQVYHLLPT